MIKRLLSPSFQESFFLFGARGTGKTTWLKTELPRLKPDLKIVRLDFLDPDTEQRYQANPGVLSDLAVAHPGHWILIDEIQKAPKVLDVVHSLIESDRRKFILTGSSSRKLKRMGANLLAGRAFVYSMHPFSIMELGVRFDLRDALQWGMLPKVLGLKKNGDKKRFLDSYAQTYVREEILIEQLVRNVTPFRNFLKIAAFESGHILNYEKISKQIGVENKTVQSYFDILEDTFLGFRLPAFDESVRKSQLRHPKFYFFDSGVQRSLTNELTNRAVPGTSAYGMSFEQLMIQECRKLNEYHELSFELSYLCTKNEAEIDLILSRGGERYAVEFKSSERVDPDRVKALQGLARDIRGCRKAFYVSCDPKPIKIAGVSCVHWSAFFKDILTGLLYSLDADKKLP